MVQAYGSVNDDRSDARGIDEVTGNDESNALLGDNATPKKPQRDGVAGLTSSVGNLANTIIGSGTFANSIHIRSSILK